MTSTTFRRATAPALLIGAASAFAFFTGCGDSESPSPVGSGGSGGSTVESGGGGSGSTGGSDTGGSGGAGTGGTIVETGGGGSGGAPEKCLADAKIQDLFEIMGDDLCAIARYDGDSPTVLTFGTPGPIDFHYTGVTWGSHGGPLYNAVDPTTASSTDLLRFKANGAGFDVDTKTAATLLPDNTYLDGAALDLGFFGWTAVGYSGAPGEGEIILVKGTDVAKRYPANAPFSFGSVVESADKGRLLFMGGSAIDDAATTSYALYAADSCGTSAANPALEGCGAPLQISQWGNASGPIAVDTLGNAFAIGVTAGAAPTQEARGFAKKQIQYGAGKTDGTTMFTLDGFGSALAAIAPTAMKDGILAFQPQDGTSGAALDVVSQPYHLASEALTTTGTPAPLLHFANADTAVSLVTDPDAKLWVATTATSGATTKLVFVVLARKP